MLSEEKEVLEYIKEAFALRSQELYKQAVEKLYKALDLDNDNVEVLYQLGELYSFMHNHHRAIDYLEQVLEINPNHIESLNLMKNIYEKEEKYLEAMTFAKQIFEQQKTCENLKEIIKLSGKLKQIDNIENYKDDALCNEDIIYEIANAFYVNGKFEQAEKFLNQNLQNEKSKILLGKIYFNNNEIEKSKEIFLSFPKNTDNAEILNYQGLFALDDMNFIEAIKCFSKASSINKNNSVYFYNLGNAYFFNGWMKEAKKAYSNAIYINPDNLDYRYALAYLYYETNEFDKCKKETDAILSVCPTYSQARVLRALLLNEQKEYGKSKEILENNLKDGHDDNFTLLALGKTYNYLDMFEKAEKTVLKVIERNPENLNYISDLADIYIKEKSFDKALELAQKTINLNPNFVYGYVLAAQIANLTGDFEKSKEYCQEVLNLDMNCSDGYYYLALVRVNEKDYDEAIECMKRAILYNAVNPQYYAKMSEIYRLKEDYQTALDYINEAESISHSTEYKLMYKELVKLNRQKS